MNARPKRLPQLWFARMGLLPFDGVVPGVAASNSAIHNREVSKGQSPVLIQTMLEHDLRSRENVHPVRE